MENSREAVWQLVSMIVDLPEVEHVESIGHGVWRVVYADAKTFGTVYAGDHPRSGDFVLASDLSELKAREARALAVPFQIDAEEDY